MTISDSPSPTLPWTCEPRGWGFADLAAILIWTAAIGIFFFDAVTLRKALFYFDITEINYTYRDFFARELKAGRFSRWFPGLYCGLPLYSESQAGYLHPLKYVLYPWLATWQALNLDTILSVWLTGLGTYGWLRRHVAAAGALTGAAIFGLGGFTWAHLIHTSMNNALTSVPFAVWALECAWAGGKLRAVALGSIALASQVFAGHLQDTLLTAGLLGLYGLYRCLIEQGRNARLYALSSTLILITLGVSIAAVQWVPSKELLDRSPRAEGLTWEKLTYGSWHPELLPTLIVREAYGTRARDTDWMDGFYPYHEMNAYLGLIALGLAVMGAAGYRDRWVGFWLILALIGSALMLGRYTALFDHVHQIPIIGSSRIPVRLHLWVSLAVAALAAVGVDRLSRAGPVRLRGAIGFGLTLIALSIPIMVYLYLPVWTQAARWTLPYHSLRFGWLGRELMVASTRTSILIVAALAVARWATRTESLRIKSILSWVLPVFVILDLLGSHWNDVPTIDPAYWTDPPASVARLKSDPKLQRIYTQAEKSSGEPGYASEPIDFMRVRDPLGWSLPPVWDLNSAIGETPIYSKRLLDYFEQASKTGGRFAIEGVSHFVLGRPEEGIRWPMQRVGGAVIYSYPDPLPRARLSRRVVSARNAQNAGELMAKLGTRVVTTTVIEAPSQPLDANDISGTATIRHDEPERVEIEVDIASTAYLILADTFDPGWSASIDDTPTQIAPANIAFRAVLVPAGKHRVIFTYRPARFALGLGFTSFGLIVAACFLLWPRRVALLGPDHGDSGWPNYWPLMFICAIAVLIFASTISFDGGTIGIQSRWSKSFHRFTWGAGIEAMTRG